MFSEHMTSRLIPLLGASLLALAACGGGEGDSSAPFAGRDVAVADTTAADTTVADTAAGEAAAGEAAAGQDRPDLPYLTDGFDLTCEEQVAFSDAAAYDASAAGPAPMVMMEWSELRDGFGRSRAELPSGWVVEDDDDLDDTSELETVQLVACLQPVQEGATSIICEIELDDGSVATRQVSYEINIYAARTAELIGTESIAGSADDCSRFDDIEESRIRRLVLVEDDQIITALADYVVPGGGAADSTEVPEAAFMLARLCTTQVGFGGLTPLEDGTGPNRVQLTQEREDGEYINRGFPGPDGWLANSQTDIESIELVACSSVGELTDNGFTCDFVADDGTINTLTLLTGTYDLVVYEATTGAVAYTSTIEANSPECPSRVLLTEGQTEIFASPSQEDYIEALRPIVEPS